MNRQGILRVGSALSVIALVVTVLATQADDAARHAVWVAHDNGATLVGGYDGAFLRHLDVGLVSAVAADSRTGRVWLATPAALLAVDTHAVAPTLSIALEPITEGRAHLAADIERGGVWLARGNRLQSFGIGAQSFVEIALPGVPTGLAVDDTGRLLVLYTDAVEVRDGVRGVLEEQISLSQPTNAITVAADDVWIAFGNRVARLPAGGKTAPPFATLGTTIHALALDRRTGESWTASGALLVHHDRAGRGLNRLPFESSIHALAITTDPRRRGDGYEALQTRTTAPPLKNPDFETVTLETVADTYLQNGPPNENHGSEPVLKLRTGGKTRPLIRFDLGDVASQIETLQSATLELHVEHNGGNWGPGREVGVHRMLAPWTELGATWRCADDVDTSNGQPDCAMQWNGGEFDSLATSAQVFTNDLLGWTAFDVTSDAELMLAGTDNHGWAIAKAGPAQNGLAHFTARESVAGHSSRLTLVFQSVDDIPPVLDILDPPDGAMLATATPDLVFAWSDDGVGVDPATLEVLADGNPIGLLCTTSDTGATCAPDTPMTEGLATIAATVADQRSNRSAPVTVAITIDTTAPVITVTSPINGSLTNETQITVVGTLSESANLTVAGVTVPLSADNSFTTSFILAEGPNAVQLAATDTAGNVATATTTVTLDSIAPVPANLALITVTEPAAGITMIAGAPDAVESAATVVITNTRTSDTVTVDAAGDGGFTASLIAVGGDVLTVVVTDAAGNDSNSVELAVPGVTDPTLPPDPSAVAPPLDRTVVTDFYDATAFLYSGPEPLQRDADPAAFERRRVAVIHGEVRDRAGLPLSRVTVSVRDQPAVGHAVTRTDGVFDLALNGGGPVVIDYRKDGYLPVQRVLETPWRDYVGADDVVMTTLDSSVTPIEAGLPTLQVARGSAESDADGTRTATVLFPAGTTVEMVLPGGNRQALTTLDVRATEYTVGEDGPEAMPGSLPPTIGYTYAVELSVDQALMAGAERVEFSQPVAFYVENFLGFPVGGHVPTASYDRGAAAWIGAPNGRVVAVLGIDSEGRATLDINGSGTAADAAMLATLGIDDEEREALASLYTPGTSLWRVPMRHFTPWDCNWPYAPPFDAIYPPSDPRNSNSDDPNDPDDSDFDPTDPDDPTDDQQEDDPCGQPGNSVLDCENQILLETVGLTGAGHALTYASDRVPGRGPAYTIKTTVSGDEVPASLLRIDLYIHIVGEWTKRTFPPEPNQSFTMVWDGQDRYGREPQGAVPVTIFKDYVYTAVYQTPGDFVQSWARFPEGPFNQAIRGRDEVVLRTVQSNDLGNFASAARGIWDARAIGLGGWSLDAHHVYDPNRRILYPGTGGIQSARRVPPVLRRVAGIGFPGPGGDGGLATEAALTSPWGVVVAPDGAVLVADTLNHRVRRIDADGTISTIAGSGRRCTIDDSGGNGDDGELGPAAIVGRVWHDVDGDGADLFFAEPGIDGVTVRAAGDINGDGTFDVFFEQITGSGIGIYVFGQLPGGVYRITVDTPTLPPAFDVATYDFDGTDTPHVATFFVVSGTVFPFADFGYIANNSGALPLPVGSIRLDGAQIHRQQLAQALTKVSMPDCGAGGPAHDVDLGEPNGLALLPDRRLLVAATAAGCVLRLETDGTLNAVAGVCTPQDTDEPPPPTCSECDALTGSLVRPFALATTAEGGFYVGEANRIRYVDPGGIIHDVVRPKFGADLGDGGPALDAKVMFPAALEVSPGGDLYIADLGHHRVRRIVPNGTITTVAGTGVEGFSGDGGPAVAARLAHPSGLVLRDDGSLFVADARNRRIRRISPDGSIHTVAGGDGVDDILEGAPAFGQALASPAGLAWHPEHSLIVTESTGHTVWRTDLALPGYSEEDVIVADRQSDQVFVFDRRGKHQRTVHSLTGEDLFRFHYDAEGRLAEIEDGDSLRTRIERDGGNPTRIIGPFGQTHDLTVNADGYLTEVVNPAGDARTFDYGNLGLLERWTDWKGQATTAGYSVTGRLQEERNAAGGLHHFDRSSNPIKGRYRVTRTTGESARTLYTVIQGKSGEVTRGRYHPDGSSVRTERRPDGSSTQTSSRGTSIETQIDPDPRFGLQSPMAGDLTMTMPSGTGLALRREREVELVDPNDPLTVATSTSRLTIAGRTYETVYDAANRRFTDTSSSGRQRVMEVDGQGRLRRATRPGVTPISIAYTPSGEVDNVRIGEGVDSRVSTFAYDEFHRLESTIDPATRVVSFSYDAANRLTRATLPDDEAIAFDYDANGDLEFLTPPGRPAYAFTYTPVGLLETVTLPDAGLGEAAETRSYDTDRRLTGLMRADGRPLTLSYDPTRQQLASIAAPHGTTSFAYDPTTGQLASVNDPDGGRLGFEYDGTLTTELTWTGEVSGTVGFAYDDTFRLAEITVDGAEPVAYGYDDDSLLTGVGAMSVSRDLQTGLVTGTSLGSVTSVTTYSAFGEPDTLSVSVGGIERYREDYTIDARGWITDLIRTVDTETIAWHYDYDLRGRVVDVARDGAPFATYTYDANGNRLTYDGTFGSIGGSYDVRDRLETYGDTTYDFDEAGVLLGKSQGAFMDAYEYDVLGNLRRAELANGQIVEYVIDGAQRRVGKRIGGIVVERFLYQDGLNPVLHVAANGTRTRFVYGTRSNVPDYFTRDGRPYRIVADHLGSVRLVVDVADGSVAQRLDYDAFGRILFDSNPGFQPFGFAGGLYDRHTGLVRFGARDYDPDTGRFTAPDPRGFAGGDTNLYAYALGNPVNLIDPSGEVAFAPFLAGAWAAIELASTIYDAYNAVTTFIDPCSDAGDFALAGGTLLAGIYAIGPASAYDDLGEGLVNVWPSSAAQMDELLGIPGRRIPDGPTTPGRNKVEWRPNRNTRITFEQHPYHPTAPNWHRGPHWHLDTPGAPHQRYVPNEPIPGYD